MSTYLVRSMSFPTSTDDVQKVRIQRFEMHQKVRQVRQEAFQEKEVEKKKELTGRLWNEALPWQFCLFNQSAWRACCWRCVIFRVETKMLCFFPTLLIVSEFFEIAKTTNKNALTSLQFSDISQIFLGHRYKNISFDVEIKRFPWINVQFASCPAQIQLWVVNSHCHDERKGRDQPITATWLQRINPKVDISSG